jgi:uncharacterized protein (DUF1501 family)
MAMKSRDKEHRRSRRDFLRQSACASLGVTGLVNALAQMRLMTAAMAQGEGTGYKALVCLFLNGGHDSNNLILPIDVASPGNLRSDYQNGRGVLSIPRETAIPLNLPTTTRAFTRHHGSEIPAMGVHPSAPELANLFNTGKAAFVCNVGTLAYPVPSRSAYTSGSVPLPPQLYSHSDQQTQWQSSIPDRPFASGWGGRAADLLQASYNSSAASKVSMSISLAGINSFQVGTGGDVVQYVVRSTGTVPLSGFSSIDNAIDNDPYDGALDTNGYRLTRDQGKRLKAFEDIMRLTHANLHEEEYNRIVRRARATEATIGAALTASATSGVDFNTAFANANHSLGDQLKMIARLIAGRSALGNNRQIFFCQVGGYDTHQTLLSSHANLVEELSTGLGAFHDALQALGMWNDVTTFTASDFNRTFTPNSSDPARAGSDHAWGGHTIVMGGAVNGGDLYGHFPSLKTGAATGSIDAGSTRGRWIPDVAVDQYAAVLTSWMGAGSNEIQAIFPNLPRFDDPFQTTSANLAFIS